MAKTPFLSILVLGFLAPGCTNSSFAQPSADSIRSALTLSHSLLQGDPLPGENASHSRAVPEAVSLIIWIEGSRDQSSPQLASLGEDHGAEITITVDRDGRPSALGASPGQPVQVCRASAPGTDLFDGSVHSLVTVINFSRGLVRLYVDGSPEAAAVFSSWRPRRLDHATAYCPENSFPALAFGNRRYVSRLLSRELSDPEIALLKPPSGHAPPFLAERFFHGTLMEFLPASASPKRTLRDR